MVVNGSQMVDLRNDRTKVRRRALLVVVMCGALFITACSGSSAQINPDDPWAEFATDLLKNATSDFEREALKDGVVTREEYEKAHELWLDCMEQVFPPGGRLSVALSADEMGLYSYLFRGSPSDEDLRIYDAASDECTKGTIGLVALLYNSMAGNPDNVPHSELVVACLVREGLVPDDYSAADYDYDQGAAPEDRNPLGPFIEPFPDGLFYCMQVGWADQD